MPTAKNTTWGIRTRPDGKIPGSPLTKTELELIIQAEDDIYWTVDMFFEFENLFASKRESQSSGKHRGGKYNQYPLYSGNYLGGFISVLLEDTDVDTDYDIIVLAFRILNEIDLFLKKVKPGDGVSADSLVPDRLEKFREYLSKRKAAGTNFERAYIAFHEDLLDRFLSGGGVGDFFPDDEDDPFGDEDTIGGMQFEKLHETLKSELETCRKNGVEMHHLRLFLLSNIELIRGNKTDGVEYFDAIPLQTAHEIKQRELAVLDMGFDISSDENYFRSRINSAVDRLLGFSLSPREMMKIYDVLKKLSREDDAREVLFRTMLVNKDHYICDNILRELKSPGDPVKDRAVEYALEIYNELDKLPPGDSDGQYSYYLANRARESAIELLKLHGRHNELINRFTEKMKIEGEKFESGIKLAEIYIVSGKVDTAAEILLSIEKDTPDNFARVKEYAQWLRRAKQHERASSVEISAYEKNPSLVFKNYLNTASVFRSAGEYEKLFEIIEKISEKELEKNQYQVSSFLGETVQTKETREAALKLLERLWNFKDDEWKTYLVREFRLRWPKSMLPKVREFVFKSLAITPDMKDRFDTIHDIVNWEKDDVTSNSTYYLARLTPEQLEEDLKLLVKYLEIYEATKSPAIWQNGKLFEAMILRRLGRADETKAVFEEILASEKLMESLEPSIGILVNELVAFEPKTEELRDRTISLLEKMMAGDHSGMIDYAIVQLMSLYAEKYGPQKSREFAIGFLENIIPQIGRARTESECIRITYAKHNFDFWEANYWIEVFALEAEKYGYLTDFLVLLRENCRNIEWRKKMYKFFDDHSETDLLMLITSSDLDVDEICANPGSYVPFGPAPGNPGSSIELGIYASIPDSFGECGCDEEEEDWDEPEDSDDATETPPADGEKEQTEELEIKLGSKFLEALPRIAKERPDDFRNMRNSLGLMLEQYPNDPYLCMAASMFALVSEEDDPLLEITRWVKNNEKTYGNHFSDASVYIGVWCIAREIFVSEKYASDAKTTNEALALTEFAITLEDGLIAYYSEEICSALFNDLHENFPENLPEEIELPEKISAVLGLYVENEEDEDQNNGERPRRERLWNSDGW